MRGRLTVLTDAAVASIIARRKAGEDVSAIARDMHTRHGRIREILEQHGLGTRDGKRFKLRAEAEEEMVARYAAGESPKALGAIYGCGALTVRHAALRHGIPLNGVGGTPKSETDEEIARIRELAAQGLSQGAIARRLHTHQTRVSRLMQAYGIPVLKKGVGRGAQHSGWKGGRSRDAKGYILVRMEPDHPFAAMRRQGGYVHEHRLVMAEYLGRPLTRRETIHHINGDITDNRLENLQLHVGNHGNGRAWRCLDCGSHNVAPVDIGHPPHASRRAPPTMNKPLGAGAQAL